MLTEDLAYYEQQQYREGHDEFQSWKEKCEAIDQDAVPKYGVQTLDTMFAVKQLESIV